MKRGSCGDTASRLHGGAEGTLTPAESQALEEHLAECPACARRATLLGELGESLRAGRRTLPPGLADRVMRRLPSEPPEPARREAPALWRWVPVAATVLLAAGVAAIGLLRPPTDARIEAPRVTVDLELADVAAESVAVAGDFNDWDAARMERGEDGVWRIRLSLQPGRYRYAFVLDGERWVADPGAPTVVDSGYGGANAVLEVSL